MTDLQHITMPIVDPKTGQATTTFYKFLRGLKNDTDDVGDDESPPTGDAIAETALTRANDIAEQLNELIALAAESSVKEASPLEDSYISEVQRVLGRVVELESMYDKAPALRSKRCAKPISSAYTTAGDQILVCTAALTVTLNNLPADNELVTIKRTNGEVIIDAGAKTIDGVSTYTMLVDYEGVDVLYVAVTDEWYKV